MNILEHPIYQNIYDLCQEIEKLPASEQATKVVVMASALEQPAAKLIGTVRALEEQAAACRKTLGYNDGDLLDNVTRYHAYATHEIELLRAGGERVAAYARNFKNCCLKTP